MIGGNWRDHPDQKLIDNTLIEAMDLEDKNEWAIFHERNRPANSSLVEYDECIRAARYLHADATFLLSKSSVPF